MAKCSCCSANWSNNLFTSDCSECGGFAITRHCPHCDGQCGAVWIRNVDMSNAFKEAYYTGGCKLKYKGNTENATVLADQFEALYQRINSPESRIAADQLFRATGAELGASYRPGRTEKIGESSKDLPDLT